jgi:hypothetical protein
VAKVTGNVTVAGQPTADILVTFTPATGRPATGKTDASGNFTLSTFSANDGAVPGSHKVKFTDARPTPEQPSDQPPAPIPPPPFNAKYVSEATSGITAEVEQGKTNEFKWDLEK